MNVNEDIYQIKLKKSGEDFYELKFQFYESIFEDSEIGDELDIILDEYELSELSNVISKFRNGDSKKNRRWNLKKRLKKVLKVW